MQPSILVTGGAGYIGAHTCKALARLGYRPIVFDNLSLGHKDFVRWGPLVVGDIRDANAVEDACRTHNVEAAIHFAAFAAVGESVTDPEKYYQNNVSGTLAFLEGLRKSGVGAVVFSSSCAVYGEPASQPITEESPTSPVNPYGASKLIVERILADYARAYGTRWIALRYFNACGADPDAEVGEFRKEETHLIPRAMMWLQGHLDEFQVFGANYQTPDGTAIRDYIHVSDLADAHVVALRRLLSGGPSGVFNLGTGRGHSVMEVLAAISRWTGTKFMPVMGERRLGDPPALIADPTRSRDQFNFVPLRSDLDTIIRTAWTWHQKCHPRRERS